MRALFRLIPTALGILPLTAASGARPPIANIANFVVKTDNLDEARRFYGVWVDFSVSREEMPLSGAPPGRRRRWIPASRRGRV